MVAKRIQVSAVRWLLFCILVCGLGLCITASNCGGGGQFRELGEKLGEMGAEGTAPDSYKYVADMHKMLYWPNEKKYSSVIPKGSILWIKDDETLAEFKGYKPGPK